MKTITNDLKLENIEVIIRERFDFKIATTLLIFLEIYKLQSQYLQQTYCSFTKQHLWQENSITQISKTIIYQFYYILHAHQNIEQKKN